MERGRVLSGYHYLVELAIEEPEILDHEVDRRGFCTFPEPTLIDPGDGTAPRFFGPGLIRASVPARSADFMTAQTSADGTASATIATESFDAWGLLRQGVRLQRIMVRWWWWREGQTLAEAVLVWRGQLSDPDIGETTFSFKAKTGTREQDAPLPPGVIGDEGRFPDAPDSARAQAMPVIYGIVRNLPIYRISPDPGASPPAAATNVDFLVCGHVAVQTATVVTDGQDMATPITGFFYGVDGRGQQYTYVTRPNTTPNWSTGSFHVTVAQGHVGPGGEVIQKLGDVLLHIVTTYGRERFLELDRDRIFAARSRLNRFTVGVIFNQPNSGSVISLLRSRFEGRFPVSFSFVGGRFGWDYAGVPEPGPPVAEIVWKQNAHSRGNLVPVDASTLRSRFEIAYGVDPFAGGNTLSISRDETSSGPCKRAHLKWGISTEQRLEVPDAANEATARLLAEDQIRRLTLRRVRTSYTCSEPDWINLPLFSRVHVTDPDRGWDGEPCLIEGITPRRPGVVDIALITEDEP